MLFIHKHERVVHIARKQDQKYIQGSYPQPLHRWIESIYWILHKVFHTWEYNSKEAIIQLEVFRNSIYKCFICNALRIMKKTCDDVRTQCKSFLDKHLPWREACRNFISKKTRYSIIHKLSTKSYNDEVKSKVRILFFYLKL